jgi:inosine-uridine nucleoside N-ribohydrolase
MHRVDYRALARALFAISLGATLGRCSPAQAAERVPILVDTDLGTDIGDAFALGFVFGSYELDVRGITTVGGNTQQRAMMICRFLTMTGRRHTAVAAGLEPQPERPITSQFPYYYHPDVLFDRTKKPEKLPAAEFLLSRLKAQPGKVTVLALGPLTNIARLLAEKPEAKALIQRIVLLESNVKLDIAAARGVIAAGVPLIVVPAEIAGDLKLDVAGVRRVLGPGTALTQQVEALYQMWDQQQPPLGDVLAATVCFESDYCELAERLVTMSEEGSLMIRLAPERKPNARVVTKLQRDRFLKWYVDRMASLVPPERNPSRLVEPGAMPHRVHVAEDYDSDIERRWWMSGKAETKLLPPERDGLRSRRACRGVLTHDFDDLLMLSRQMHTAVIFNPVPGPPMGKNTRLSFRYWLKGTDAIRVQIYSLTNGYHRHLVVKGLPQEEWRHATVDMTQARRPDGTGGPLGEGERIDDIQFYVDPRAEILIDDIVLYDAAAEGEKRPFPKRIIFAGGFDSGAQGKEWPGDFEIVPDQGYFWRAARSVENKSADNKSAGAAWIRLGLRGPRRLGSATHFSFRYRLTGTDRLSLSLVDAVNKRSVTADAQGLKTGQWAQAMVEFPIAKRSGPSERKDGEHNDIAQADEIHFHLPKGAILLIDDVLLGEW